MKNTLYVLFISIVWVACVSSSEKGQQLKQLDGMWTSSESTDSSEIVLQFDYSEISGMNRLDINTLRITPTDTFKSWTDYVFYDHGKVTFNGMPYLTDSISADSVNLIWGFFMNEMEVDPYDKEEAESKFYMYFKQGDNLLVRKDSSMTMYLRRN